MHDGSMHLYINGLSHIVMQHKHAGGGKNTVQREKNCLVENKTKVNYGELCHLKSAA